MSGIGGIIRLDGARVAPHDVEAMLATMERRGPDRRRSWCGPTAALGQVLLATTPEALAETQPWVHPETGCVVVADSRLDNRPELLRMLGITRALPDEVGDGELLHAAWQRWGEGCADHLLGDFAFAIWDPRARRVFCARDVMGVRPFYYHVAPGRLFAFASETGALLTLADVPKDLDEGRIADALVRELEGIDRTSTFYRAVVRLAPAHTLQLETGALKIREYWHPLMHRPSGLPHTETGWIEALHDEVQQAVRRRLRSSRRVGSMLSGGLDSSSIVALASGLLRAEGGDRLATFSATNSKGEGPETTAIRSMLRKFDTDATIIDLQSIESVAPALRQRLRQMAEPFDGTMMLISAIYDAAAAHGVRCLLDGIPADNLYTTSGYIHQMVRNGRWLNAYREANESNRREQKRFSEARALKAVIGAWSPAFFRRFRQRQGGRLFFEKELVDATLIRRDFALRVGLWDRYLRYQANTISANAWDSSGKALSGMSAAYITAGVERYGREGAFCGVEPRHPFLDRRLIEFHAWLPIELRARDDWQKWALRQAVQRSLPPDVVWRRDWEHLGLSFNMAVIGPLCEGVATQARSDPSLGDLVDSEKAEAALQLWRDRRDVQSFNTLHMTALVGWWLRHSPMPA